MQAHADEIGAVIVGFPATTDLGDDTQQWSEEPVADHAYIQYRLSIISKSIPLDLERVVLFGFSQGAMVAGDLASLYPDSYSGAILMSPGGIGMPMASEKRLTSHSSQRYFCFCGAEEHPGNVELTKAYAQHFRSVLGAEVTLKLYPGIDQHTRPPDFMEKFPDWASEILKKENQNQSSHTTPASAPR
ncbi:hypothetical protein VDG1235_2099 [Verrucomicrobiia bacterium DG1235]|nr:hypothetical protein VDG1235_2099 [Verrucomicrobiae bacterium DG1235]